MNNFPTTSLLVGAQNATFSEVQFFFIRVGVLTIEFPEDKPVPFLQFPPFSMVPDAMLIGGVVVPLDFEALRDL